ncbi:hypothetical protein CRUP_010113, partial [Coryphaenoides rupestris]
MACRLTATRSLCDDTRVTGHVDDQGTTTSTTSTRHLLHPPATLITVIGRPGDDDLHHLHPPPPPPARYSDYCHRVSLIRINLTDGCGNESCTNQFCASCRHFLPVDKNSAAVKALELYKVNAKLCGPHKKDPDPDPDPDPDRPETSTNGVQLDRMMSEDDLDMFPTKEAFSDVHYLTEDSVSVILSFCEEEGDYAALIRVIGRVFSSAEALTHSFRKSSPCSAAGAAGGGDADTEGETAPPVDDAAGAAAAASPASPASTPGSASSPLVSDGDGDGDGGDLSLDVEAVRRVYERLQANEQTESSLVNALIYLCPNLELDLEYLDMYHTNRDYLNVFVLVMENGNLHSPEYLEVALPLFCKAMCKLPVDAHARLAHVWSRSGADNIRRLTETFQQLITFTIVSNEYDGDSLVNDDDTVVR